MYKYLVTIYYLSGGTLNTVKEQYVVDTLEQAKNIINDYIDTKLFGQTIYNSSKISMVKVGGTDEHNT